MQNSEALGALGLVYCFGAKAKDMSMSSTAAVVLLALRACSLRCLIPACLGILLASKESERAVVVVGFSEAKALLLPLVLRSPRVVQLPQVLLRILQM